jgi:hypothetical protein
MPAHIERSLTRLSAIWLKEVTMRCLGTQTLPSLVAIVVLSACGLASTAPSRSPALATVPPTPSATIAASMLASPSHASATQSSIAEPTDAPTPTALVLGGSWVLPKAGAKLTSYTTTLSARATASGPGVTTFTKVVFVGSWPGTTEAVMCTVTTPADSEAWSCRADLVALGVPPGKVTFSFDVYGEGVPVTRAPAGPRHVTYAVSPPKPTDPQWNEIGRGETPDATRYRSFELSWSALTGYADTFVVYETWECPRASKENDGTPCFIAGTPVDVSRLQLLATAPGDARSVTVRVTESDCGPPSGTILLRARNAYGRSAFSIVTVLDVYWPDPDEIIC